MAENLNGVIYHEKTQEALNVYGPVAILAKPWARKNINPTSGNQTFGTSSNPTPRGFDVVVGGSVTFTTLNDETFTRTYVAGDRFVGELKSTTASTSTSTSIDLLY